MYKYEITFIDKSVITVTTQYMSKSTVVSVLEDRAEFLVMGDYIIRKAHILSIREVKDDE